MPTVEDPATDADAVQTALRALAHATCLIDDPAQSCSNLGSLSSAVPSLSQSLHSDRRVPRRSGTDERLGARGVRERPLRVLPGAVGSAPAGEMIRQVGDVIANAREAEAILTYHREFPDQSRSITPGPDHGIGL